jgi:hypothetical protein
VIRLIEVSCRGYSTCRLQQDHRKGHRLLLRRLRSLHPPANAAGFGPASASAAGFSSASAPADDDTASILLFLSYLEPREVRSSSALYKVRKAAMRCIIHIPGHKPPAGYR